MLAQLGDTVLEQTPDGRGRGLFLVAGKRAGDQLIAEQSPALWMTRSCSTTDCAFCCKHVEESTSYDIICGVCKRVSYCSVSCQERDLNHHNFACPFLVKSLELGLEEDADACVSMCAAVAYLMHHRPEEFRSVMSQDGGSTVLIAEEEATCEEALRVFQECGADSITKPFIIELYKKDKACGFAVMKPPHLRLHESEQDVEEADSDNKKMSAAEDNVGKKAASEDNDNDEDEDAWEDLDTESVVKGFGIYPYLSLINHSCLPNCIRWDSVDAPADSNVSAQERRSINFRALSSLPAGAELLHSYVPISWSLDERQDYLQDMFGFTCQCDRCITEMVIEGRNGKKATSGLNASEKKAYKQQYAYIQLYLEKHSCGENGCSGALTPVVGFDEAVPGYDFYECNVCLRKRSHADFMNTVNELRRS